MPSTPCPTDPLAQHARTDAAHLPRLSAAEFAKFFEAAHDMAPYAWQVRLAQRVFETRQWPRELSLPCGVGRCALADIAIFHLALEAEAGDERRAPLRIAQVLDRRTITNSFFDHAMQLAKRLSATLGSNDDEHILTRVARRLTYLARSHPPLAVRTLAGGAPQEGDWTPSASHPTVVCSSIDAVGSRLLFRGYGVSASMKPLHAGLFGGDSLVILDDIRSEAFRQTLSAVDRLRRAPWSTCAAAPWATVDVKISPSHDPAVFGLSRADREHPELARRLLASKPARLLLARARSTNVAAHAEELIEQVWSRSGFATGTRGRTVAIVVNTIGLARACYRTLESRIAGCADARSLLLIGRARTAERDRRVRQEMNRLVRGEAQDNATLFVIATQSVETGPDFDFDVLVTQIASIDALQQRFARLNRRGRTRAEEAVILACRDEISASAEDAPYGSAAKNTWAWLLECAQHGDELAGAREKDLGGARGYRGIVDFGSEVIERRLHCADTAPLVGAVPDAPMLMPAYLDLLSQTSPMPAADPEVDLFLNGDPDAGDVTIIWRADVTLDTNAEIEQSCAVLEALPPRPQESLAMPVVAARAWLREQPPPAISDLQGVVLSVPRPAKANPAPPAGRPALRWAGPQDRATRRIYAHALRAGDLIVVPISYGGADEMGWLAETDTHRDAPPATDLSEDFLAAETAASRALRLHPALLGVLLAREGSHAGVKRSVDAIWRTLWRTFVASADRSDGADIARRFAQVSQLPELWVKRLRRLARSKNVTLTAPGDEAESFRVGILFIDLDPRPTQTAESDVPTSPSTTEQHEPPFEAPPVTLDEYARRFEASAAAASASATFPAALASDIVLAARLSVEGRRDPRYQGYLRGGDRMASALALVPLATPTVLYESAEEARRARERVELPEAWCPEAESVRLAVSDPRMTEAHDRLLVLWLIGTLYGVGRPLHSHTDPLYSGPWSLHVRIEGQDWPEVFLTLRRRYGWWGLSHLEAIARLAEHRAWQGEQVNVEAPD